jgi:hypothetical protein
LASGSSHQRMLALMVSLLPTFPELALSCFT